MSELKITVRNKIATADGQKVVCGNSDYQVRFDLDTEWDAYTTKTMRVVYHDHSYTDVVFTGAVADLPAVENQSIIRVGLFAGNLHTTTPALFPCELSIRSGSGSPAAPTPSVYDQILAVLAALGVEIGDLDDLETEDKSSFAAAINETLEKANSGGFNIHAQTAENDLADGDEMPFYDVSASATRKTTWANIKAKLKTYFDTLYLTASALTDYATKAWVQAQGYLTQHQSLAAYRTSAAQDAIDATKAAASDVDAIEAKIPSAASSSNQLADKDFVNSSIGTNTAYYISNSGEPFTSLAQLQAYSGTITNNDYAFVTGTDENGNTYFDRYKATVSGSTVTWAKEYRLNNSSFTAAQWSAITSGITAQLVASFSAHFADTAIHVTANDKTAWNSKYAKPSGGIPSSDMSSAVQTSLGKADSAVQPEAGKGLFSGSYNDLSNKPSIPSKTSDITNDSGYIPKFHINVYYDGIDFFVLTPFSDIIEALSSGKEVSVIFKNGVTIEIPYLKTTNNKVWFYTTLRFAQGITCIIDSEDNVKMYCTSQKTYWDENDEEYKANPCAIFAAAQDYFKDTDGNARSLITRITITETSTETEIQISATESETVQQVSYSYAASRTFEQIHTAWENGLTPWCIDSNYSCYDLFLYSPAEGNNLAAFVFTQEVDCGYVVGYKIMSDNTVETISIQVYELEDEDE